MRAPEPTGRVRPAVVRRRAAGPIVRQSIALAGAALVGSASIGLACAPAGEPGAAHRDDVETPEAVAAAYLDALVAEDWEAAARQTHPRTVGRAARQLRESYDDLPEPLNFVPTDDPAAPYRRATKAELREIRREYHAMSASPRIPGAETAAELEGMDSLTLHAAMLEAAGVGRGTGRLRPWNETERELREAAGCTFPKEDPAPFVETYRLVGSETEDTVAHVYAYPEPSGGALNAAPQPPLWVRLHADTADGWWVIAGPDPPPYRSSSAALDRSNCDVPAPAPGGQVGADGSTPTEIAEALFAALDASDWQSAATFFDPQFLEREQRAFIAVQRETAARNPPPAVDPSEIWDGVMATPLAEVEAWSALEFRARILEGRDSRRSFVRFYGPRVDHPACPRGILAREIAQPPVREYTVLDEIPAREDGWAFVAHRAKPRMLDLDPAIPLAHPPPAFLRLRRTAAGWRVWDYGPEQEVRFEPFDVGDACHEALPEVRWKFAY